MFKNTVSLLDLSIFDVILICESSDPNFTHGRRRSCHHQPEKKSFSFFLLSFMFSMQKTNFQIWLRPTPPPPQALTTTTNN